MKTELKIVLMVWALVWPGVVQAENEYPFWRLVAKSYLIVEGTMEVPVAAILKAEQSGDHEYVEVPVAVTTALKGKLESPGFKFRYYTDTEQYGGVSRRKIISLNGQPVVVLLQNVREKYYLAVYAAEAMQSASADLADRIHQEVSAQEKLVQASDSYASGNVLPKESEVQSLVELMVNRRTDPGTAQEVYEAVIALGQEAVSAIIKYMDDRRKLTIPKIFAGPLVAGRA